GGADAFGHLWIRVDYIAGLIRGRFGNGAHLEYVTLNFRSSAGEPRIQHVLFQHLVKRSKRRALVRVVIKHLLLSDGSERLDRGSLVGRLQRRFPTSHAKCNKDSDDRN